MTTAADSVTSSPVAASYRPAARGKFLFLGEEKLFIRGATYGAFRPDEKGNEFHDRDVINRDFAMMAANGMTAVRIPHTTPPRSLLDIAQHHGLHVMVGLSAEQYVGYLIDKKDAPDIEAQVRAKVRTCAGHPALLCYAIGNEVPAPIVRWLGRRRVENFLRRMYDIIKAEDPDSLVTYVNYPTTEYLQLPFLDLLSFNVYLETQERLEAYLFRLQNIAGDRPLIMSEIGLDSLRNGQDKQASVLDWQVRSAFTAGCAGTFIFSWTDEWYTGADVTDWAFGLTDRERRPKPALTAIRKSFAEIPFPLELSWPRFSVILCTYNGSRAIRQCLEGLQELEYPSFEVIVVNDGSTDATAEIVREYDVRLINTEQGGLSRARNIGLEAATGELVAYIDDDAYPDPHWLTYLASTFKNTTYVAVGGPNIPPPGDGVIAECVANVPGNPTHVLFTDRDAEHIPGCNMAFRKAALRAIGGFDPQFRIAGDDVDVCWRLQQRGWKLGFSPTAVVWHHRRNSMGTFWRQQYNYGRAEASLAAKWPEKYNAAGYLTWRGRVYEGGSTSILGWTNRIYHGVWGSAPFQSLYQPASNGFGSLPLTPEWYILNIILAILTLLGALWTPLLLAFPLLVLTVGASCCRASLGALSCDFPSNPRSRTVRLKLRLLTAFLHLYQPLARLWGRLRAGTSLEPLSNLANLSLPRLHHWRLWTEDGQPPEQWLESIEAGIRTQGVAVFRGGDYDGWDLEVRGGIRGAVRMLMALEEHGGGRQLVRFRVWPWWSSGWFFLTLLTALLAVGAAFDQVWIVAILLGLAAIVLFLRTLHECSIALAAVKQVIKEPEGVTVTVLSAPE